MATISSLALRTPCTWLGQFIGSGDGLGGMNPNPNPIKLRSRPLRIEANKRVKKIRQVRPFNPCSPSSFSLFFVLISVEFSLYKNSGNFEGGYRWGRENWRASEGEGWFFPQLSSPVWQSWSRFTSLAQVLFLPYFWYPSFLYFFSFLNEILPYPHFYHLSDVY